MPTTTSTRSVPAPKLPFWHRQAGTITRQGALALQELSASQTTTSFRSNERLDRGGESARSKLDGKDLRKTLGQDRGVGKRQYDTGHDFYTKKQWTEFGEPTVRCRSGTANYGFYEYWGPMAPISALAAGKSYPSLESYESDASTRLADGRKYINKTIPTAPEVNLAALLGEMRREGLPHLTSTILRKKGVSLSNLGGEYLNYTFGIAPTVSEVQKMALSVLKANKMAKELQYRRNTDTVVRKRSTLAETSRAIMVAEDTYFGPPYMESDGVSPQNTFFRYYSSEGYSTVIDLVTNRKWFSGAWSYHLAESHSFLGKLQHYEQKANHLLGVRLTPEAIWELTPWSWLIDYFTDAGTFLSNLSYLSSDNLVLRYGYVMHETRVQRIISNKKLTLHPGASGPRSCSRSEYFHSKRRTRSTPYGFGVDLGALSPRRWAILAALGFTKTDKGLNLRD